MDTKKPEPKIYSYSDSFGNAMSKLADAITDKIRNSEVIDKAKKAALFGLMVGTVALSNTSLANNTKNVEQDAANANLKSAMIQNAVIMESATKVTNGNGIQYDVTKNEATVSIASEKEAEKALSSITKLANKVKSRFAKFREDEIRISLTNGFEPCVANARKLTGHKTKRDDGKPNRDDMYLQHNDMYGDMFNLMSQLNVAAKAYGQTQAFASFLKDNAKNLDGLYNNDVLGAKTTGLYEKSEFFSVREDVGKKLGIPSSLDDPLTIQRKADREKEISYSQRIILNTLEKASQNNQGLTMEDLHKAYTSSLDNYSEYDNKNHPNQTRDLKAYFMGKVVKQMVESKAIELRGDKFFAKGATMNIVAEKPAQTQAKTMEAKM